MNKQIVDERQVKGRWQIETQASGSVGRYIKKEGKRGNTRQKKEIKFYMLVDSVSGPWQANQSANPLIHQLTAHQVDSRA